MAMATRCVCVLRIISWIDGSNSHEHHPCLSPHHPPDERLARAGAAAPPPPLPPLAVAALAVAAKPPRHPWATRRRAASSGRGARCVCVCVCDVSLRRPQHQNKHLKSNTTAVGVGGGCLAYPPRHGARLVACTSLASALGPTRQNTRTHGSQSPTDNHIHTFSPLKSHKRTHVTSNPQPPLCFQTSLLLKSNTQLRGRVSFAPTGSEAEDGQRLLSFALKWYAGARLALLAVGTGELYVMQGTGSMYDSSCVEGSPYVGCCSSCGRPIQRTDGRCALPLQGRASSTSCPGPSVRYPLLPCSACVSRHTHHLSPSPHSPSPHNNNHKQPSSSGLLPGLGPPSWAGGPWAGIRASPQRRRPISTRLCCTGQ